MRKLKRVLAMVLALCLTLNMNAVNIFADNTEPNVEINGNGGEFTAKDSYSSWTTNGWGLSVPEGSSLKAEGYTVENPVYWDNDAPIVGTEGRQFTGWTINTIQTWTDEWDNERTDWRQIDGTGILTTEEMLDYPIPSERVMFRAQWAGDDDDYNSQIFIEGYGASFTGNRIEYVWNESTQTEEKVIQETETYEGSFGQYLRQDGTGIAQQMANYWEFGTEPSRDGAAFEGWLEFEVVQGVDDQGNHYETRVLVDDTVYTTAQMLAKPIPEYNVAYVAKWSDIAVEEYFNNNGGDDSGNFEPNVEIYGNGGEFTAKDSSGIWTTNGWGLPIPEGSSLKAEGYTVENPVYWDNDAPIVGTEGRQFTGWTINMIQTWTDEWDNECTDWRPIDGTGILTTEEMLDYPIPSERVMFMAQWAGDDDDYNSQIFIEGYGVSFTGNRIEYVWDESTQTEEKVIQETETYEGSFGQYLRQDGTGIAQQTGRYWEFGTEPSRDDAVFEGWLEFEVVQGVDDQGNYYEKRVLVDDTVYTTAQMLAKPVPAYNVAYVAKWSDMAAYEYFYDGPWVNVSFIGNGGTFTGTNKYDTRTTEWFDADCIPGAAVSKMIYSVTEPVYWDADPDNNVAGRKFLGWSLIKEVAKEHEDGGFYPEFTPVAGMELVDTATALAYVIPSELVDKDVFLRFEAQWDGDDSDYYSQVFFDGYNGEFTFDEMIWENDSQQAVTNKTGRWSTSLKESAKTDSNESIGTQTADYFFNVTAPVRNDGSTAEFKGWAEFKILSYKGEGDFDKVELVSDTLLTTAQVFAKEVPSYDVVYAAVWDDSDLDSYYVDFYQFAVNGNGGRIYGTDKTTGNEVSCDAFEFGVREDQTLADAKTETMDSVRKACAEFTGYEVYTAEHIYWDQVQVGAQPVIDSTYQIAFYLGRFDNQDTNEVLDTYYVLEHYALVDTDATIAELLALGGDAHYYAQATWKPLGHTPGNTVIENIVEPTAEKAGSHDLVVYCKECGEELSRTTVPVAAINPPVKHPETNQDMMINVESSVTEVPETIKETYPTVNDIQDAMTEASLKEDNSLSADKLNVVVHEVKLLVEVEENVWEEATTENFPTEGVTITLPYPEGTGADKYTFVITHMITTGERAGEIEVLEYEATEDGLVAKVMSLSPIAIAYQKQNEHPFTDIKDGAWYYNSVMYAYKNGLLTGTSDTTFEPNSPMTRGMLVTVLYRMEGRPKVSEDAPTFPDVNSKKFYANAISWAAQENLVSGYKDGTFGPEDSITREQIAKILYRYAEYKGYDVTASQSLDEYQDASQVSSYAVKYLKWATAEGMIKGSKGLLNPKGDATRAEISAMMRRFIEKYE